MILSEPSGGCDGGVCALGPLFAAIAGLIGAGAGAVALGSLAAIVAGATRRPFVRSGAAPSPVLESASPLMVLAATELLPPTGRPVPDVDAIPDFRPHPWWLRLLLSAARYFSRALSLVAAALLAFGFPNAAAQAALPAALLVHVPFRDEKTTVITRAGVALVMGAGAVVAFLNEDAWPLFRAMWVAAAMVALAAAARSRRGWFATRTLEPRKEG